MFGSFLGCTRTFMLMLGNELPAQIRVPITRLPVQRQLLCGQSLGSQGRRICTACVQDGKLRRAGRTYYLTFNDNTS